MMQRLIRALLQLLAAVLAFPTTAQPLPSAQARIVVQSARSDWIDVAAWTPDSRFLFTALGKTRDLLLWDIERGLIVDRVTLPGYANELDGETRYVGMQRSADGKSLLISGDGWTNDLQRVKLAVSIDIASHATTLQTHPYPVLEAKAAEAQYRSRLSAAANGDPERRDADVERATFLRAYPTSPDGRWQFIADGQQFSLKSGDGTIRRLALPMARRAIMRAEISPDRKKLAISRPSSTAHALVVEIHDLLTGALQRQLELPNTVDFIGWGDDRYFLAVPSDEGKDPKSPAQADIVDSGNGIVMGNVPMACMMKPIPYGFAIGIAMRGDTCLKTFPEEADFTTSLVRITLDRLERLRLPTPGFEELLAGFLLQGITPSQRGEMFALDLIDPYRQELLMLFDGRVHNGMGIRLPASRQRNPTLASQAVGFSPGARTLWLGREGEVLEWPINDQAVQGEPRRVTIGVQQPAVIESNGQQLLIAGHDGRLSLADVGAAAARLELSFTPNIRAAGFLTGRPIIWAVSPEGRRLWDSRTGAVLLTSYYLGDGFVSVAADGRYDTNLGPDSQAFRWVVPDAPFQSLAPQTFMRDYFEPDLARKLIDCTTAGTCARALPPLPPIAGLNRALPDVALGPVTADPRRRGWANVTVEVTDTPDATGTLRGVYGAKLLINNREVARAPELAATVDGVGAGNWRQANRSTPDPDGRYRFHLNVPLASDGKRIELAAYAFNDDRVKSDTARLVWQPPPMPLRPRRAFVLTVGINDYEEGRLALNFAVPDALLITNRLARIPGHQMRHASLTTARLPDGKVRRVTRADVEDALAILAGNDGEPAALKRRLRAHGHNADALDRLTPDDILILSFSGHGHADASGHFALLPSDVKWPARRDAPEAATVLDVNNLTRRLQAIQAREIALIIDACHSGAAVAVPGFKPGPMGDAGLGQLAFDKGLRILAATQAGDVALENAALRHGFLSAALGEGLAHHPADSFFFPADDDYDDRVMLDEWLRYAVQRLPTLEAEVRRGGSINLARGVRLLMRKPAAAARPSQEPSLFDFNRAPSPVVLREGATQ